MLCLESLNIINAKHWLHRLRPHKSTSNGDISSSKKNSPDGDASMNKKNAMDGDTADTISLKSSYSNRSVHSLKDEQVMALPLCSDLWLDFCCKYEGYSLDRIKMTEWNQWTWPKNWQRRTLTFEYDQKYNKFYHNYEH